MREKSEKIDNVPVPTKELSIKVPCTVSEALEIIGVGKVQMYAVLATTLCLLYYLLDIIGAGMILPAATCELRMDTIKKGIFTSAPFLGLVLTSHLWGFLTDWFGRQRIIVFSLWSALFFYIVAALVPNFWVMVVLRFFSGLSNAGAQSAMYPYVGELLTDRTRSKLMVVIGYATAGALFLMSGVGWLLHLYGSTLHISDSYAIAPWRQQILILAIPGIISAALFNFLPESPKWLGTRGRTEQAFEVLQYIHQKNCNGKMVFPIHALANEVAPDELQTKKSLLHTITSFLHETKVLFRKPFLWPVLGMCLIQYGLYTVGDAFAIWYPELVNRLSASEGELKICHVLSQPSAVHGGGPAVDNWDDCKVEVREKMFIDNMIVGAGYLVSNVCFYFFNTKVRIFYIVVGAISASSICCFVLPSLINQTAIVVCFTIFFIGAGASINMANVLLVEIFPVFICGMALGLAQLMGRLSTFIGINLIGTLLETDCEAVIYVTASLLAVGVMSLVMLPRKIVVESKN